MIIAVRNLSFVYPSGGIALRTIGLNVQAGESLALLGPNGSGKTTLVRLMAGILKPTQGFVCVFGYPADQVPPSIKNDWAFQFQDRPGLYAELTVREHILLYKGYYDDAFPLQDLFEVTQLEDILDQRVERLSWGQRRRLELALALLPRPKLLILDEPTAGLDIETRERIWILLRQLADQGTTLFLTSHDPSEVEELVQRVIVIKRGALLFDDRLEVFIRMAGSVKDSYLKLVGVLRE